MSKQRADLFDIHLLEQEARRRCASSGVNVVFREDIPTALYDFKSHTVALPTIKPEHVYDETEYRAMLIHEIGHANRKDVVTRAVGLDMTSTYGRLLNAVEDQVMERKISEDWYGDGVSLGLGHRRMVEHDTKFVLEKTSEVGDMDENSVKWTAAYVTGERTRTWDKISKAEREVLEDVLPDKVVKLVNELDKEGWTDRLLKTNTCDEVYQYTTDLYKRLYPEDKDKDPEKEARKGGAGKGKGGEATGEKGKGDPSEEASENMTHWSLLKKAEATFTGGLGGKIDYSGYHYRNPGDSPMLLPTKVMEPKSSGRYSKLNVPDLPVAGQLRILLLSEGKAKIQTELTSGKLDKRKLARLALPVVPGTDSWRKVFRKRIPAKKLNTAITVMVDGSGSMGCMAGSDGKSKMQVAAAAASAVVKALTGPLRIPTEVVGFSTYGATNIVVPAKTFTEKVVPDVINQRLLGLPMSGNSDGEALLWGVERLLKRKEKRKIMLVMSDGCPADSQNGNPGDILNWAIGACRKRGVEVYGIGINDNSVKHFYGKDCKVINDLHELAPALVTTLASKLHRK